MGVRELASRRGQLSAVPEAAFGDLAERLRGEMLTPGVDGYDEQRALWNGMIDRRPALIVQCASAADVVAALAFVREHDVLLAVRGGGHNVAGNAMCDNGVVIDLSLMRDVRVDPSLQTVRVGPGCRWNDVDAETQAFGLATTGGTVSNTGFGGLTLGGGLGHLMSLHGTTADNVRSLDVVTAAGEYIEVSERDHADLFWAMRGAGANFGIVTSFELAVHPVGPTIYAGAAMFPIERAAEILRLLRTVCASAPDELALGCATVPGPDGQPLIAIGVGWFGPSDEGDRVVGPIRALGPLLDTYGSSS